MELIYAFFTKLTTIFIGSGFITYCAFLIAKEISLIPSIIFEEEKNKKLKEKLSCQRAQKISLQSGFYEVLYPNSEPLKLFSSHKGMKILS